MLEAEFRALAAIIQALLPLSPAARERILRYAIEYSRDELGDGPTKMAVTVPSEPTAPAPQPAAQAAQAAQPAAPAPAMTQQPAAAAGPDNPFAGM